MKKTIAVDGAYTSQQAGCGNPAKHTVMQRKESFYAFAPYLSITQVPSKEISPLYPVQ